MVKVFIQLLLIIPYFFDLNYQLCCKAFFLKAYSLNGRFTNYFTSIAPIKQTASTYSTQSPNGIYHDELQQTLQNLLSHHEDTESLLQSQLSILLKLVQSDIPLKGIYDEYDQSPRTLPPLYQTTLQFIGQLLSEIENVSNMNVLQPVLKLIVKKEGLLKHIRSKSTLNLTNRILSSKDVIDLKRKIERSLSMILTIWTAAQRIGCTADLVTFSKLIIEKLTHHDKHWTLLLLCREVLQSSSTIPTLSESTESISQSPMTSSARLLYPFLAASLHAYYCSTEAISETMIPDRNTSAIVNNQIMTLFATCSQVERIVDQMKYIPHLGDDILSILLRWITEKYSEYFQSFESLYANQYHEEVVKNQVINDLLVTDRTFHLNFKKQRIEYQRLVIQLGRYVHDIVQLAEHYRRRSYDPLTTRSEDQDRVSDLSDPFMMALNFTSNIKKYLAVMDLRKALPISNPIRKRFEQQYSLSSIQSRSGGREVNNDHIWMTGKGFIPSEVDPREGLSSMDDELFYDTKPPRSISSKNHRTAPMTSSPPTDPPLLPQTADDVLGWLLTLWIESIEKTAHHPKVSLSTQQRETVLQEIEAVFRTWRRPHLLFEYYLIHLAEWKKSSTPSNQSHLQLYIRFLKALFSCCSNETDETVDSIRYHDPHNLHQLQYFDSDLLAAWIKGRTATNEILPGYNDPQTLFMCGEDSATCMSIRSKLSASNRGLLSIALHGNTRILGVKDRSGRLKVRSVVRLLIDAASGQPVLYVDAPYGDTSDRTQYVTLFDEASSLGKALDLPVVYAVVPTEEEYMLSSHEIPSISGTPPETMASESPMDDGSESLYQQIEVPSFDPLIEMKDEDDFFGPSKPKLTMTTPAVKGSSNATMANQEVSSMKTNDSSIPSDSVALLDYSSLAPFIWVNGLLNTSSKSYLSSHFTPRLITHPRYSKKKNSSIDRFNVTFGIRPKLILETLSQSQSFRSARVVSHPTTAVKALNVTAEADHLDMDNEDDLDGMYEKVLADSKRKRLAPSKQVHSVQKRLYLRQGVIQEKRRSLSEVRKGPFNRDNMDGKEAANEDRPSPVDAVASPITATPMKKKTVSIEEDGDFY